MELDNNDDVQKVKSGQSGNLDKNKYIRTNRFEMRLSNEELAVLKNRFKESDLKVMASYAREILLYGSTHSKFEQNKINTELKLFTKAVNRVGNNLNQIARAINTQPDTPINQEALKEINSIKSQVKDIKQYLLKFKSIIENKK